MASVYFLACARENEGGGIYRYEFSESEKPHKVGYFACDRPTYAAVKDGEIYVLLRNAFGENSGCLRIDRQLMEAGGLFPTLGEEACHIYAADEGCYIANYGSGSVSLDGRAVVVRSGSGPDRVRQDGPHTHFVGPTPDGLLAVTDLGTDTVAIYDRGLTLVSEARVPAGHGVRHLVFSRDGKFIYTINELVPSVSTFAYADGRATLLSTTPIPCRVSTATGAAICLTSDGRLFASVRDENIICEFVARGENVTLVRTFDCRGRGPRDFDFVHGRLFCANELSGTVTVFDARTLEYQCSLPIPRALGVTSFPNE